MAIIEYEPLEKCLEALTCPRCGQVHKVTTTASIRSNSVVERCAICGSEALFVRKDFPQGLGLAIVVVFGAIAIYFFQVSLVKAWLTLAAAVLLDVAIYLAIGKVTTCYACRAEYRKCDVNPAHEGFDLATSEKF